MILKAEISNSFILEEWFVQKVITIVFCFDGLFFRQFSKMEPKEIWSFVIVKIVSFVKWFFNLQSETIISSGLELSAKLEKEV